MKLQFSVMYEIKTLHMWKLTNCLDKMWIHAMQCNAMQCNAMQCNAMQCNAMQCNAIQCNAMQCNAMQCNVCNVIRGDVMRCDAMHHNAMRCDAMQCNAMSCSAMRCGSNKRSRITYLAYSIVWNENEPLFYLCVFDLPQWGDSYIFTCSLNMLAA